MRRTRLPYGHAGRFTWPGVLGTALLAAVLALSCAVSRDALAWELLARPGVTGAATYDDNVFFRDEADFELRLTPSLTLEANTERTKTKFSSRGDDYRYAELNEFDRFNHQHDLEASHELTPRWALTFKGNVTVDQTFEDVLEQEGVVTDKSERLRYSVNPGARWSLDERTVTDLGVQYAVTDQEQEELADLEVWSVSVGFARRLGDELTTVLARGSFQNVDIESRDSSGTQRVYQALFGAERKISERLTVALLPGVGWTESSFDADALESDSSDLTYLVQASARWQWPRYSFALTYDRDITQSVFGEAITRNRFAARGGYDFTERLALSLSVDYTSSTTDGIQAERESQSVNSAARLSYRLDEDSAVSLEYRRNDVIEEREGSDSENHRNRITLQYSRAFPFSF